MSIKRINDREATEEGFRPTDRRRLLMAAGTAVVGAALPVGVALWASPAAAQCYGAR